MTTQEQSLSVLTATCPVLPATPLRGLPAKLCRRGAALLNLQCWLWGQDIRRAEGNLLLQYGADRLRPPKNVTGCSQYSFALTASTSLKLWGFGIYVGENHCNINTSEPALGCYLNRYEFVPRRASGTDCWNSEVFRSAPRNPQLKFVPDALRWIAKYEEWVLRQIGTRWRLAAAAGGPDGNPIATTLTAHWSTLAREIERWEEQRTLRRRALV